MPAGNATVETVTEARARLEAYLQRLGLTQPADSAFRFQISLLRQWVDHLDAVLDDEHLPWDTRSRIITGMIYGGTPNLAEAGVREDMVQMAVTGMRHPDSAP